jgi:hypothetical protein
MELKQIQSRRRHILGTGFEDDNLQYLSTSATYKALCLHDMYVYRNTA